MPMSKMLTIIGGLIAMAGGVILAVFVWWHEFYEFVFGFIPPILFFGGLIALIAGISSIKDAMRTKMLEEETKEEMAGPHGDNDIPPNIHGNDEPPTNN